MRTCFKKLFSNEQGSAVLLVSLGLVGLLGIAGLVIDVGMVYYNKSHLKKVANAAVLSAAQELTNSEDVVSNVLHEILEAHGETGSIHSSNIILEDKVEISLQKTVPLAFLRIVGFDSVDVFSKSVAQLRVMGRATGAAPLGIDEQVNLEFYKDYELKVDASGVEYGTFGVLALGGSGAETYEENLLNGYQNEIKVGDILETQTGNISGKTRSAIQERIDGCDENPRDVNERDCSRVILIPVYKPYTILTNQLSEVEITGFAYFYITDPMSLRDTSVKGMFIKRAGKGFEKPASVYKGAYAIRLTE